ncbi:hypothetical protein MD484_g7611, partial [Candolleomyces efflorescens]
MSRDHPTDPLNEIYKTPNTQIDEDTILNFLPAWKRSVHQLLEQPMSSQAGVRCAHVHAGARCV